MLSWCASLFARKLCHFSCGSCFHLHIKCGRFVEDIWTSPSNLGIKLMTFLIFLSHHVQKDYQCNLEKVFSIVWPCANKGIDDKFELFHIHGFDHQDFTLCLSIQGFVTYNVRNIGSLLLLAALGQTWVQELLRNNKPLNHRPFRK